MEVVACCGIGKIMLPSGDTFIQDLVRKCNHNQNRECVETCLASIKRYDEERKKDPIKSARDATTSKRYKSTPRCKNNNQGYTRNKLVREMGYMSVDVPHITHLVRQPQVNFNFIEKHQHGLCSKISMSLKELMNTQLHKLSFIDIDGVTGGDPEYVSNKMHYIAVYSMQKEQ